MGISVNSNENKSTVDTSFDIGFSPNNLDNNQTQPLTDLAPIQNISATAVAEKQLVDAGRIRQAALLDQQLSPTGFDYNQIQELQNNPNVTPEFIREVEAMAERLGARPEHILAAMSFETGGSFSASETNGIGATGLIQFIPSTARGLGTSTDALRNMTPIQQLEYVEKYFEPFTGRLNTLEQVYTSILSGSPKSSPDDVLFRRGTRAYDLNPLDWNRDGQVTAQEATTPVTARMFGGIGTVQRALLEGNHVRINERAGFADNRWGPRTAAAVRSFQEASGLPATGNLDEVTARRLFNLPNTPPNNPPRPTTPTPSTGAIPNAGLTRGNRGAEVEKLQDLLIRFGEMTEAQKATGPGIFGPRTESSLRDFQRSAGISPTGTFDNSTKEAMQSILNGVRKGERSILVERMQDRLVDLGFMTESQQATGPGIFGNKTDAALRNFQRQNGLGIDGIFGPNSFRAMHNSNVAPSGNNPATPPTSILYTTNSNVVISAEMAPRLENLARAYQERTGQKLHITSGYRPPARQASAMAGLIERRGATYVRNLYRNKTAVNEIINAYNRGGVNEMTRVIEGQVARGTYISNHLQSNAVDLSINSNERVLRDIVSQLGGSVLNEGDHLHIRLS